MKSVIFALIIYPLSLASASAAAPAKANYLDALLGSYSAQNAPARPGEKPFALFFKEAVFIKSQNKTVIRYSFVLSDEKMKLLNPDLIREAFQIYVDEAGNFFQFWSFGRYIEPAQVDFIDLYAKGEPCGWQPARAYQHTVDMDYCGDSAPRDVFTFGKGMVSWKEYDKSGWSPFPAITRQQVFRKD